MAASKPESLRICHLADLHLGYRRYAKTNKVGVNQREADVNSAFQESVARVIQLKPDLIIIAGDIFHSVRPSNTVLTLCFRQIRKLARETGAPILLCGGNHETPRRSDTGSPLQVLAEIEGVYVADLEANWFRFPDLGAAVLLLPHQVFAEGALPELRADDRFEHNILVAHAQVEESWISDFGGVDIALSKLNPHEWDLIALGHVHLYRKIGRNGFYSGSIEHTSSNIWGEARELKGFLEIELPSLKRTFHPLTAPREVISLEPVDAEGLAPDQVMNALLERISAIPGGVDGKIVRLELVNFPREAYRYLDHRELRSIRAKALNLTLDIRVGDAPARSARGALKPRGGLKSELTSFAESWGTDDSLRKALSERILNYLSQVEQSDEAP